jgi:tetratricopeptide (TPR) repeat protein
VNIRNAFLCLTTLAVLALAACQKAEEAQGDSLEARATAAFEKKNYDKALELLREAEKEKPGDPLILNMIGATYTKKQEFATAKEYFEKSLAANPSFFPAFFNVGELMFLQKQYPQALGHFTNMLGRAPGNELLQFKVVLCLLETDQQEDAAKLAKRIRVPGESPAWYYAQAAVLYKAGDRREAAKSIESARTLFGKGTALYDETFTDLGWSVR